MLLKPCCIVGQTLNCVWTQNLCVCLTVVAAVLFWKTLRLISRNFPAVCLMSMYDETWRCMLAASRNPKVCMRIQKNCEVHWLLLLVFVWTYCYCCAVGHAVDWWWVLMKMLMPCLFETLWTCPEIHLDSCYVCLCWMLLSISFGWMMMMRNVCCCCYMNTTLPRNLHAHVIWLLCHEELCLPCCLLNVCMMITWCCYNGWSIFVLLLITNANAAVIWTKHHDQKIHVKYIECCCLVAVCYMLLETHYAMPWLFVDDGWCCLKTIAVCLHCWPCC